MSRGIRIAALLAVLPFVGTLGFMLIEGWTVFDSLYMAVITLTTVGFHEVHNLSTPGRAFVMMYLVVGDATDDRTLLDAGIERARGLGTVLSDDADNLYIVISARVLAPKLQIIARASPEHRPRKVRSRCKRRVQTA